MDWWLPNVIYYRCAMFSEVLLLRKSLLLQLRGAGLSVKLSVLLGRDGEVDRMKEMRKQREEINDKNSNYACACSYSQTCPVSIKAQTS
jgi:hypothetical protein